MQEIECEFHGVGIRVEKQEGQIRRGEVLNGKRGHYGGYQYMHRACMYVYLYVGCRVYVWLVCGVCVCVCEGVGM